MKKNCPILTLVLCVFLSFSCHKLNEKPNTDRNIKGCGDFIVNKIISSDMMLSIQISHSKVSFSTDFQTFDNIAPANFATVEIQQSCDIEQLLQNTCNDAIVPLSCQTTLWKLQQGKLSFKVSKVLPSYNCMEEYLATVILYNATFQKEGSSETKTLEEVALKNVLVGWCAG